MLAIRLVKISMVASSTSRTAISTTKAEATAPPQVSLMLPLRMMSPNIWVSAMMRVRKSVGLR